GTPAKRAASPSACSRPSAFRCMPAARPAKAWPEWSLAAWRIRKKRVIGIVPGGAGHCHPPAGDRNGNVPATARRFHRVRIGVLTFHRCINYGSYWQARCLVEGLRARGHDPVVIDHVSRRVDIAEWRCAFRPTLPEPGPSADRPCYRAKIRRFGKAVRALPLSAPYPLEGRVDPQCDLVVVGSDEVWNLAHPWYGGVPLFYGQGLQSARLVSYAASFGNHDARWALAPEQARWLGDFDRISVRDGNSVRIVEQALGRAPELVLDPCLQFPPGDAEVDEADASVGQPRTPYIALYGHGFSPQLARRVRDWARRRGLAVVSIGYRNAWADRQWLDAGPHAFARFMAGAEAVVTNFFHGCVFA